MKILDLAAVNNKYSVIYADPPWQYNTWTGGESRTAESHYAVMTKKDIEQLPVNQIAADDAVLFLWVTYPCLEQGMELLKKWGFKYKTVGFTWVKLNKKSDTPFVGLGHYTRANAEICLIASKGKNLTKVSKSVRQIIMSRREEHSKKPDEARNRIVQLYGDVPRIELFARQAEKGWDVWGWEAPEN